MVVSIQSSQKNQQSETSKSVLDKLSNSKISLSAASQLQLLTELQSSLDLRTLLGVFLHHLQDFVAVDGLHFQEEKRQLSVRIGKQSVHSCGYRLLEETTDHGEIVLKRSKRFSSSELELIESLVVCLLTPISNSLRFTDAAKAAVTGPVLNTGGQLILADSLCREIELAKRHNHSLSIILIEYDARVYGGMDSSAADITTNILQASRSTDMLFRTGINSFGLLLHKADLANTSVVMKRLKTRLFTAIANSDSSQFGFGIATLTGTDSLSSLLERAEKAITGSDCSESDYLQKILN